jgi:hypothetical protein
MSEIDDLRYEVNHLKKKLDEKQADYLGVTPTFTVNVEAMKTPEDFVKALTFWGFHRGNWQNFINPEELTPWIEMAGNLKPTGANTGEKE